MMLTSFAKVSFKKTPLQLCGFSGSHFLLYKFHSLDSGVEPVFLDEFSKKMNGFSRKTLGHVYMVSSQNPAVLCCSSYM